MRIARVLTRLNLGGPARQVLASDPLLGARGHQIRIFAGQPEPGEGDLFELARARGLDVVRVPGLARGWSLAGDLRARAFLREQIDAFAPEVLHTHASKAGALARSAVRGGSVARVHTFHGHVLEGFFGSTVSRGLIAIERKLAASTDAIVAVSHATAEDLLRLQVVDAAKLVVIPPGVDLDPFLELPRGVGRLHARVRAPADALLVGIVGRLAEVKRTELAVDVLELLAARYPRLHLVFVGDGDQRGVLERRIRALPGELASRAHMLGAVEDMTEVLGDLFCLLSTSRSEGMPVSMIEAGAAALPVVATPAGGVAELVMHERTGWIGNDVDELAYGLAQLLEQPDLARAMGQRARVRVQDKHSAASLAQRLEQLYRAVLGARR